MKKILSIIFFLTLCGGSLFAQRIKRQVIGSYGTRHVMVNAGGSQFCLAATVGQPPNAGTISDGKNTLRQGFQQPNDENCPLKVSFEASKSQQGCGINYAFEFTGDLAPNLSISWNFGANASPMLADGAVPPVISFAQPGQQTISVTVGDGVCQKTIAQILDAQGEPFLAAAEKTDALCFGTKGSIDLTVQGGNAPFVFKWSNDKTTEDLSGLNPGEYNFTVTDAAGCTFSGSETVEGPTAPPALAAEVRDELCKDTRDGSIEITLANATQPLVFSWSDGAATGAKRDSLTKGDYAVTITDANGCKTDTAFSIRVFCDLEEKDFIPDVFSPNGDGVNDLWNVEMLDRFPGHTVQLFNRWGNVIWEAEGNFAGWDGRNSKGGEMPVGAYFYIIELNDPTAKVYKGSVTLIR